ncbi:MAG: Gfo/Idh/MocA family oxidoreductase [Clostridia bacterium]|nr:Gfo/Idh/MocA family oxidoreductase [Clostridia bacterium]
MEKFRWCFIGAGKLGGIVAKLLVESGRHEIASCYTRDFEKAKAFCSTYGGNAYDNPIDAVNDPNVDAVYIVTTHNVHLKYAKIAIDNNKPVFVEKAFTMNAKEADELVAYAKEKDVFIAEAMWTWFSSPANKVLEWVNDGKVGKVKKAKFSFSMKSINYAPRVSDPRRGGGALLDITVYPITYAYRLFGYPTKIESSAKFQNSVDVSDVVKFEFENGIKVDIVSSIVDLKGEKFTIYGEKGIITAPFYHWYNSVTYKKNIFKKEVYRGGEANGISYVDEFDSVAQDIRDGLKESRMVPIKATLDIMKIMDEIASQIGLVYKDLES